MRKKREHGTTATAAMLHDRLRLRACMIARALRRTEDCSEKLS
jgi:hypothetical protein